MSMYLQNSQLFHKEKMDLFTLKEDELNSQQTPRIPKIIHQTYKNTSIPDKWRRSYDSCHEVNSGYQFILWTDEKMRDFLSEHYPWFLHTYDAYPYNIQRIDAFRYFAIYHYGG
jgi:mannosyltransferase OCH1-like enzyme